MQRSLRPPPKVVLASPSFDDDVKREMFKLKQLATASTNLPTEHIMNPNSPVRELARDSSTRTFATDDGSGGGFDIRDYNDGEGNENTYLPLIPGISQGLNNTTPGRVNNVLNNKGFDYSSSPNNSSPARRVGGGIRDIMGEGQYDRSNKRAADQAAYAAALQEQINSKKTNPDGNTYKLGKNESYRWRGTPITLC